MLRPQVVEDPKPLKWWPDEINEYYEYKHYESYYGGKTMFFAITNEQSEFAWEDLSNAVKESGDITGIIDEALSAWGYVVDAGKQRHLMTSKEKQQYSHELQETLSKSAKDIEKIYRHNTSYFTIQDRFILAKMTTDLDVISKSITIPTLADGMGEKSTHLRGVVYLARKLEKIIRDYTDNPHHKAISGLIAAVFDNPEGDFSPERIRDWCRSG